MKHAVTVFADEVAAGAKGSRSACVTFLDRIGFRNLGDPAAVKVFSPDAGHELRAALPLSVTLTHVTIERLGECDPAEKNVTDPVSPVLIVAYLWFARCAALAADALPVDDRDSAAYLEFLAAMPLNTERYGPAFRRHLVRHPACPADVLYTAALDWPVEEVAGYVAAHPNTPEEAQVALALRGASPEPIGFGGSAATRMHRYGR